MLTGSAPPTPIPGPSSGAGAGDRAWPWASPAPSPGCAALPGVSQPGDETSPTPDGPPLPTVTPGRCGADRGSASQCGGRREPRQRRCPPASTRRRRFAVQIRRRRQGGPAARLLEVGLRAAAVPPPAASLQLGRCDPVGDLLGCPEMPQDRGRAQLRRDPGRLRVPQDLAKQTGLGDCLGGGPRRPEHNEQWRRHRQLPAPPVRLPVRMMWQPAGQGGGRLGGELDNPTLAPATSSCTGSWPSPPQMMSPRCRTHTSLGRRPTSPGSRRMALSRRPTGVVRSGSRSSRSY
jgi:hypothetical protein